VKPKTEITKKQWLAEEAERTGMKLTPSELLVEWNHIRSTRLGILCEDREPTPEQIHIAEAEADEHVRRLADPDTQKGQGLLL
jgi:hypothetical protein